MIDQRVEDDFLVRYYYWALEEVKKEVRENFRFLRTFRSGIPYRLLKMAEHMDRHEAIEVLTALVKRRMIKARRILGEESDQSNEDIWLQRLSVIERPRPDELEMREHEAATKAHVAAHKRDMVLKLEQGLRSLFQVKAYHYEALNWRYDFQICGWPLQTWIDLGGRGSKLRYHHSVGTLGEQMLHENINLCSWLGLSSSTQWNDVWQEDPSYLAQALVEICKHFLDSAPKLLTNLGVH